MADKQWNLHMERTEHGGIVSCVMIIWHCEALKQQKLKKRAIHFLFLNFIDDCT